jgi:hypothetical protein
MSYLLLFGTGGWSQRWEIPGGQDERVEHEISRVGHEGTGHLPVIDSQTNTEATLVIAWQSVAAAVLVDAHDTATSGTSTGQYA